MRKDIVSRNPVGLISTFSNNSLKGSQMSTEDIEIKAKKLMIYPQSKESKKASADSSISIFAGFRTNKGSNPKKLEKINQDRILIAPNFNNVTNQWVF